VSTVTGNTMPSLNRGTHWCWTSFEEKWKPNFDEKAMRFMVYQKEKCPKTGKIHYQGYIQFLLKQTLKSAKTFLNPTVHLEKANADPLANIAYCTKTETRVEGPWKFGEVCKERERTDLKTAAALAIENKFSQINPEVFVKFHKGLGALRLLHNKPQIREVKVTVIWGPTGVGKSHKANDMLPDAYWKPPGPWWDGYDGEEQVVIDEFDPEGHNVSDVLRWLDKWPLRVPVKGGFVPYCAREIVVTSHFNPKQWYPKRLDEVLRRITNNLNLTCTEPKK